MSSNILLPEFIGQSELGHDRPLQRRVVIDAAGNVAFGKAELPLPVGGDDHLHDAGEDAPLGEEVDVVLHPDEVEDDGDDHEGGRDPKPDRPADGVLDVDYKGEGDDEDDGEGHVVPVEEAVDPLPPLRRRRVELVDAERDAARPDPSGSDREEPEPDRQDPDLGLGGRGALRPRSAWGRVELRDPSDQGQRNHSLNTIK